VTKRKALGLAANDCGLYPAAHDDSNGALVDVTPDELADALVQPEQPVPEQTPEQRANRILPSSALPAAPRPRRISIEVVKAETKLIQIERNRDESLQRQALSWDLKRMHYIASLPEDVRAALVALKVLGADDLTGESTELEPADD
jgi:hypothetical protein